MLLIRDMGEVIRLEENDFKITYVGALSLSIANKQLHTNAT